MPYNGPRRQSAGPGCKKVVVCRVHLIGSQRAVDGSFEPVFCQSCKVIVCPQIAKYVS